jgi:hypothetical protein
MHTPRRWSTCVGAEHPATERGYPRSPLGPRRNSLASADCLAKHRRRRRNRRTPTHGVPRAQGAVQSPAVTAAMSSADSPTIARLASKARITKGRPPRRFSLAAARPTPILMAALVNCCVFPTASKRLPQSASHRSGRRQGHSQFRLRARASPWPRLYRERQQTHP